MTHIDHERYMQRALYLSNLAVQKGNHPFGAVLVMEDNIVMEAMNTIHTDHDVTRHAELNLVSKASQLFTQEQLALATLYTTTEPCAMCSGAIYWSGISSIVYAASANDLDLIAGKFLACHSTHVFKNAMNPPKVLGGILIKDAIAQHKAYWPYL